MSMQNDVIEKDVTPLNADAQSLAQPVTENRTAYFTDGEMFPWKGTWFRLRLREINGEKLLTLEKVKSTESSVKRAERTTRWLQQHPKSQRSEVARFNSIVRSLSSARSGLQSLQAS